MDVLIGLISKCFSEEADVIRRSALFPYFDSVFLSYEQGVQKPNAVIFNRCLDKLVISRVVLGITNNLVNWT